MPPGADAVRDALQPRDDIAGTIMFLPTFPPSDSTSDPRRNDVHHRHHQAPDRHLVDRSDSFLDRLRRQAPRRLDVPRRLQAGRRQPRHRGRRHPRDRGHRAGRESRDRGARADGAPAQRGLLRRRHASRARRSGARRSSRSTTATCASAATSRSAASTRPVELDAEIEGVGDGPDGNTRIGIAATGAIDRSDWGITWNAPLANGAFAVAERVKLNLHVEAVLKA